MDHFNEKKQLWNLEDLHLSQKRTSLPNQTDQESAKV